MRIVFFEQWYSNAEMALLKRYPTLMALNVLKQPFRCSYDQICCVPLTHIGIAKNESENPATLFTGRCRVKLSSLKLRYDQKARDKLLEPGQEVLVFAAVVKKSVASKILRTVQNFEKPGTGRLLDRHTQQKENAS